MTHHHSTSTSSACAFSGPSGELGIAAKRDINIDAGQSTSALNEGLHVSGGGAKRTDQGSFNSTAVIGNSFP